MVETPNRSRWTRRRFLTTAGLSGGALLAGRPGPSVAQGALKSITVSHSVSTFVYGQHLVAAQNSSRTRG
jgi:hypothetical protein